MQRKSDLFAAWRTARRARTRMFATEASSGQPLRLCGVVRYYQLGSGLIHHTSRHMIANDLTYDGKTKVQESPTTLIAHHQPTCSQRATYTQPLLSSYSHSSRGVRVYPDDIKLSPQHQRVMSTVSSTTSNAPTPNSSPLSSPSSHSTSSPFAEYGVVPFPYIPREPPGMFNVPGLFQPSDLHRLTTIAMKQYVFTLAISI